MTALVWKILCVKKVCPKSNGLLTEPGAIEQVFHQSLWLLTIQKGPQKIDPNDSSTMNDLLGKFICQISLMIPNTPEIGVAG